MSVRVQKWRQVSPIRHQLYSTQIPYWRFTEKDFEWILKGMKINKNTRMGQLKALTKLKQIVEMWIGD